MIILGLDDTDSRNGGCTTHVGYEIITRLFSKGIAIPVGYPALVRLNPNVPWKTRGNGSVSIELAPLCIINDINNIRQYHDKYLPTPIGASGNMIIRGLRPEWWHALATSKNMMQTMSNESKDAWYESVWQIAQEAIEEFTRVGEDPERTQSGLIMVTTDEESNNDMPHFWDNWYWTGVRNVIDVSDITSVLDNSPGSWRRMSWGKHGRGLIGAFCAIAWKKRLDDKNRTWEILTYRPSDRWGTERQIDPESISTMEKTITTTFDNRDIDNHYYNVIPHSPCPILFGIRGTEPSDLIRARDLIRSEHAMGYILYESNQGSDDHIQQTPISRISSYASVMIQGTVTDNPRTIKGGHVIFGLCEKEQEHDNGESTKRISAEHTIDCAAYEPTKQFRDIIRQFAPGDEITIFGGIREEPLTVNIEKIRIHSCAPRSPIKRANPECPECGRQMKSIGNKKGFRCKKCHIKLPESAAYYDQPDCPLKPGWYEVPPIARRHLSRPLALLDREKHTETLN